MESEWVRIMPFIGKPLPFTAVNSDYPGVSESKEIYEYFSQLNPKNPIDEFKSFYFSLSTLPRMGQTKMDQILEALRLRKLGITVQSEIEDVNPHNSIPEIENPAKEEISAEGN